MTPAARRALIEAPLPTVRYIPSKSWAGVLRDPELKFANRMDRDDTDMAVFLMLPHVGRNSPTPGMWTSGVRGLYDNDD